MPFNLNWHELDIQTGTYSNHSQLQVNINNFPEFADQEGDLFRLGEGSLGSKFINLYTMFLYSKKQTTTSSLSYWHILTTVLARPYYDYNYYQPNMLNSKPISWLDEKHKCCELTPSSFDVSNGCFTVPASVGKNWRNGTKIAIAPKEYILSNTAGIAPTVLPTFFKYNPYLNNNEPPTVIETYSPFAPSGNFAYSSFYGFEPERISLRKISDTLFKPFLFHYSQSLMNAGYGPLNIYGYDKRLPFYENYKTKFLAQLASAGSNYVLNVYEPRTVFSSGKAFSISTARPVGHPTQGYYSQARQDATESFFFQSWLDNRYVNLNENKITVSELTQPVSSYASAYTSSSGTIGIFPEYPTGTAVQVYPSRFWKYYGYSSIGADYATDSPITLSGEQYIGSVFVTEGKTVLVKDQPDKKQNGVYVVKKTAWQIYYWWTSIQTQDPNEYFKKGMRVTVYYQEPKKYLSYVVDAPYVVGTSEITFRQIESFIGVNDPDELKDTVLPEGLERGKVYFLIRGSNWIKFAKSYQDALDGIAVPLLTVGRGLIGVYAADSLIGFPEKILTRDENGQPLTTEPLSPEKTYYLVNKGTRFGLAETQGDAIAGNCLPLYQKPNTYFTLEPINYRTRTPTAYYNEAQTSYIWNPLDETKNCCTDMTHLLPVLGSDGTELGLIADDVPSYLTIPITVEVPPDEKLRLPPVTNKYKATWVYDNVFSPNSGYYDYQLDESLPDGSHSLNGNSNATAAVNAINANLASALSGNLILYFAGKGKARDFFPSSNSYNTYASWNNSRPLPTHGNFLFYKGKKQAVKRSLYEGTNYFWKGIAGPAVYTCNEVSPGSDFYWGIINSGSGYTSYGCTFPYQQTVFNPDGTTTHYHCGYFVEIVSWETGMESFTSTLYTGMNLQVWLVVDAITGEKYAYFQVDQKDSTSWAVPYLLAPVNEYSNNGTNGYGTYWSGGPLTYSQMDVTNFLVHGSYYGTGNVLYRNYDSNYLPSALTQGGYNFYYYGSYYAPESWYFTGGVDLSPASLAITNTRKFAGQTALELHFKTPVYHIWKKACPVKKGFVNSGYNITPSNLTKIDYDADLSTIQENIICTYDPETKKYKSQPLVSNGVNFRVEIVPDRDLTGIKVYGAPNSFVKMYADFEYYTTTSNNTDLALQKTDVNPHPFTGNTHSVNVWTLYGYKTIKYLIGNELPILDPMISPTSQNTYTFGSYVVGDKDTSYYQTWYAEILGFARFVAPIPSVNLFYPKYIPNENNPVTLIYLLSCSIV